MHVSRYPFTVRLIGFSPAENTQLETLLAQAPELGPSYFCLHDDSLQEPDLYIADGGNPAALARLALPVQAPLKRPVGLATSPAGR